MKILLRILVFLIVTQGWSQAEKSLEALRERMDDIASFSVAVQLETDIEFIQMPVKNATMKYQRDQPVKVESEDFVLIPKRGLDLMMTELFRYDFITVPRGEQELGGASCYVMNIIPEDKRADYAIATLYLDKAHNKLVQAEIQTRKEGAYTLNMTYGRVDDILPEKVEVSFEVEKVKIPMRYLAREGEVDKEVIRAEGTKKGRVILYLSNYNIALIK